MSPTPPPAAPQAPVISARDLALTGKRGLVFGPIDLSIEPGTLTILQGPQGSGRTALLLTIAGRMKPDRTTEELRVYGHDLPAGRSRVQHLAGIAGFDGIDDLDGSVTVAAVLRERLSLIAPWYRRTPAVTRGTYERYARPVFGERALPGLETVVWDLDELDVMLLRIVVALLQRPELLVVDDLDQVHDADRREIVWQRLDALAESGLTVVAAVASAAEPGTVTWPGAAPRVITIERSAAFAERARPQAADGAPSTTSHALPEGD